MNKAQKYIQKHFLGVCISLIVLLMVTAATLGWYNKQAMINTSQAKLTAEQVKQHLSKIFGAHLAKMDLGLRGYAITQNEQLLIPYAEAVKETETTMRKLDSLLQLQRLDTSVVALAHFKQNLHTYLEHCEKMKQEAKSGNLESFKSLLKADKGFGLWKSYEKFLLDHLAYEEAVIERAEAGYSAAMNSNLIVQAMLLGIGLPTLLLLLRRLKQEARNRQKLLMELEENNQQYLYHPGSASADSKFASAREVVAHSIGNFKQASALVKAMALGDYKVDWEGLGEANLKLNQHTLAGELMRMREQLRENKESSEKRNWANEGLHQFSLLVRSQHASSEKLCQESISFLTTYLAAQQGSLFTVQGDGKEVYLTLAACYAFNRRKHLEKRIEVGSGLVGQCYLEEETILLTEIPQGYPSITSGLGDATPTCILIVPIKHNDQIEAILELAGFQRFDNSQIAFLEKAGEYLASTLAGLKTTTYMEQLLKASQQQAQELRITEEEMRQNLEEFAATQEEMRRQQQAHISQIEQLEALHERNMVQMQQNQTELRGMISAVNSTLATIEFDPSGIILTANEIFLQVMGYQLDEIKGKSHRLFVDPEYGRSANYQQFWNDLQQGKAQVGEVKRIARNGADVWLSASYTPLLDEHQNPLKIIKFAQDITAQKQTTLDHQGQLEAIAKSNAVVEFDLEGHILEANENFLSLMGYDLSEVKGQHHSLFVTDQERTSAGYRAFWKQLKEGQFVSGEFERVTKEGKAVWIKGSYNAIRNLSGKPYKVVKYAQDITPQKLLELENRHQDEALCTAEEEMRQQLEELLVIQEEMQQKQQEYLARIAQLEGKH